MSARPKTLHNPSAITSRLEQVLLAGLATKGQAQAAGPVLDAEQIEAIDAVLNAEQRQRGRQALQRLAVRWKRWRAREGRLDELAGELRLRTDAKNATPWNAELLRAVNAHKASRSERALSMRQFKRDRREAPSPASLDMLSDDLVQLTLSDSVSRGAWPLEVCKDIEAYCRTQKRACTDFTFRQAVINGFLGEIPDGIKTIENLRVFLDEAWKASASMWADPPEEWQPPESDDDDDDATRDDEGPYPEHKHKRRDFLIDTMAQAEHFTDEVLPGITSWRDLLLQLCRDMFSALSRKARGRNYWRRVVEWCFESNVASWNHRQLAMFLDAAYFTGNAQTARDTLNTRSALCGLISTRCLISFGLVMGDWLAYTRALRDVPGIDAGFMSMFHVAAPGSSDEQMREIYRALRLTGTGHQHFYISPRIWEVIGADPTAWWAAFIIAGRSFTDEWLPLHNAMVEANRMLTTAKEFMTVQFTLGIGTMPPDMLERFAPINTVEICMNLAAIAACAYNMLPNTQGRQNVVPGWRGRRFVWEAFAEADDSTRPHWHAHIGNEPVLPETVYYKMQRWVEALMIATMRQGDSGLPIAQRANGIDNFVMPPSGRFYTARERQPQPRMWWEGEGAYDAYETVQDARRDDDSDDDPDAPPL